MEKIASLHWWMIEDKSFFKSMQRDDSDIYTKQSESIFQENSNNIYSVILVNEHFVYKHICEGSILRAGLISIYDIYKFYDIC